MNEQVAEEDVFQNIYRHESAKLFISRALQDGNTHVMMEGPPGSGKSVFLMELDARLPDTTLYRDGKNVTASGLRDTLKDDPGILLIDEIDALDNQAYDILSIPMEHGRLVRDSAKDEYDVEVGTQIIGACNDISQLPEHIQNRFRTIEFEKYGDDEFVDMCGEMLVDKVEWVESAETGEEIGRTVLEQTGTPNVRYTVGLAQMSESLADMKVLTRAKENPDEKIEVEPLKPGDIARAKDEVGKMHIKNELVEEMVGSGGGVSKEDVEDEIEQAVESATAG